MKEFSNYLTRVNNYLRKMDNKVSNVLALIQIVMIVLKFTLITDVSWLIIGFPTLASGLLIVTGFMITLAVVAISSFIRLSKQDKMK